MSMDGNAVEMRASEPAEFAGEEFSLLDALITLARYKRRIIGCTVAAAGVSLAVALSLPNIYVASTKVLPPQQGASGAAAMLAQLGGAAGAAGGLAALKNPNDLYVGMLKSRTLKDALIDRFDLCKVFNVATRTDARRVLEGRMEVVSGRDGLITLDFEDGDPDFAAKVANSFIEELYKLTQTIAITEASQRRLFYEQQLRAARDKLAAAEQALKQHQQKTGLLMLSEQSRASIESVARVRGQIAAKELQIQSMRMFATDHNPDLKFAEQELAGLRGQLAKIQQSEPGDILVPTSKIPDEGLEYGRRLRDVKYAEVIVEVLSKQYELARLEEGKNASLIQVLDSAVPPEQKSKPRRALIATFGTLMGFLLAAASAFVSESAKRARLDPKHASRLAELRSLFRAR